MSLNNLFEPKSIGVVGASESPGRIGYEIVKNILEGGYRGDVFPVHPDLDSLLGKTCYPDLKSIPADIDLVIIAVGAGQVFEIIRQAADRGVKALIVLSAGFSETGAEGGEREQEMRDYCQRHDIRLLGPNCLGVINGNIGLNASIVGRIPETGGISIFSQSGALCSAMIDFAAEHRLGLSKVVSIGNKADISEVDMLAYLSADENTRVIVGYLEDISTGNNFVKAAEEAASRKPVVLLKAGITSAGRRAARSHTGALAATDIAYAAAFKRSGVIRAETFMSLFDYASALSTQPLPEGDRILIITNAGGPGTMAADAIELAEMRVTEPDHGAGIPGGPEENNSLRSTPVDVLGNTDPTRYVEAVSRGLKNPEVDSILVLLTPQVMTDASEIAAAIARVIDGTKPVLTAFMGGRRVLPGHEELTTSGLPDFCCPERAVSALKKMYHYHLWKERPPRLVTRFRVNRRRVERIINRRRRTGVFQLGEVKGKDILDAYGFKVPAGALAGSSEEAVEIAERLGFPVAIKIVSPHIIHKSDMGGVMLNVSSAEAVSDGFDLMMLKIGKRAPGAKVEGIYVEQMAPKGLEVIIGMNRDPQFGPMLMFGLGGIFVEVMKDVTFYLAPITEEEAIQMLKSTRSYEMLERRRGREEVDISAIAAGLQRISQLTTDFPQITELDINPFIIGGFGTEPMVADVRMTLAPLPEEE
ncbi:MAG: acetate--CoA ligase family protein [Thermodesulfobacteriota bacterium]